LLEVSFPSVASTTVRFRFVYLRGGRDGKKRWEEEKGRRVEGSSPTEPAIRRGRELDTAIL